VLGFGSGLGFLVWVRGGAGVWVKVRVTVDLDPLSQESYGHNRYMQKVKVNGNLVQKLKSGWMDGGDCITSHANNIIITETDYE